MSSDQNDGVHAHKNTSKSSSILPQQYLGNKSCITYARAHKDLHVTYSQRRQELHLMLLNSLLSVQSLSPTQANRRSIEESGQLLRTISKLHKDLASAESACLQYQRDAKSSEDRAQLWEENVCRMQEKNACLERELGVQTAKIVESERKFALLSGELREERKRCSIAIEKVCNLSSYDDSGVSIQYVRGMESYHPEEACRSGEV